MDPELLMRLLMGGQGGNPAQAQGLIQQLLAQGAGGSQFPLATQGGPGIMGGGPGSPPQPYTTPPGSPSRALAPYGPTPVVDAARGPRRAPSARRTVPNSTNTPDTTVTGKAPPAKGKPKPKGKLGKLGLGKLGGGLGAALAIPWLISMLFGSFEERQNVKLQKEGMKNKTLADAMLVNQDTARRVSDDARADVSMERQEQMMERMSDKEQENLVMSLLASTMRGGREDALAGFSRDARTQGGPSSMDVQQALAGINTNSVFGSLGIR